MRDGKNIALKWLTDDAAALGELQNLANLLQACIPRFELVLVDVHVAIRSEIAIEKGCFARSTVMSCRGSAVPYNPLRTATHGKPTKRTTSRVSLGINGVFVDLTRGAVVQDTSSS
jgi:hypothetical protein